MPTLSIDVTTQVATRVQNAYEAESLADLKAKIIAQIKKTVVDYETKLAETTARASLRTAEDTYITSVQTAKTTAESEIILT